MQEPKHKTIKVRMSTYRELKKLAAEKPEALAALVDRLLQSDRNLRAVAYQQRRLIAVTQSLIGAHRYPHMYKVEEAFNGAEDEWKEANQNLLDLGL